MTTLADRDSTALIVIDVQNQVVTGSHDRDDVVGRIAGLVGRARGEGVAVVWVQHNSDEVQTGTEGWQIVPELAPAEGEPVVQKRWGDSSEATDLEDHLARLRVGHLVVTGAQTDACVRSTIHGAFTRRYDATLVGDAHTTQDLSQWGAPKPADVIAHTNLYWQHQSAPGREAGVVEAAEVDFAPRG